MVRRGPRAKLLAKERRELTTRLFYELVLWEVPKPVRGSEHNFKYRLALVSDNVCVLRYDNEAGKGDHRHDRAGETPYVFIDTTRLLDDFLSEVSEWLKLDDT